MYRATLESGSWVGYPVTIEIGNNCPVCGGPRGKPYSYNFCEDGEWFTVDRWENPCGHIDKYGDCIREAQTITGKEPICNG